MSRDISIINNFLKSRKPPYSCLIQDVQLGHSLNQNVLNANIYCYLDDWHENDYFFTTPHVLGIEDPREAHSIICRIFEYLKGELTIRGWDVEEARLGTYSNASSDFTSGDALGNPFNSSLIPSSNKAYIGSYLNFVTSSTIHGAILERMSRRKNWNDIYAVYEILLELDPTLVNKQLSKTKQSLFTHTANTPHSAVDTTKRHGTQDKDPPKSPMTLMQGYNLILPIVCTWFDNQLT